MPLPPQGQSGWKPGFSRRLGYYLLGLSIGLIMLGFLWMARTAERQQREADDQVSPTPTAPASPQ